MRSARTSYQQGLFLDLLSVLARRPAALCIHKSAIRPINTSSSSTAPQTPRAIPPQVTSAPKVPLRMLLDRNSSNTSAISKIPIPKGERGEKFTPSPLTRPIGLPYPPRPGQNSPHSDLSWRERRDAYVDSENVGIRRRKLVRSFLRPYFLEWRRLDHWKGKSFVGTERLFKKDRALWFPNLWGWNLARNGSEGKDTTPLLQGKVSLVGIQSGLWAEEQVRTFLGAKENPELQGVIEANKSLVQKVDVNIQDHWLRLLLVKIFKYRLRKTRPESEWKKYFMVRLGRDTEMGLTEDIRDAMGLLNSQVGYVYLLDTDCRIRWAGSGHAWEGETKSLNAGVQRLVQEAREHKVSVETPVAPSDAIREGDLLEEVQRALA